MKRCCIKKKSRSLAKQEKEQTIIKNESKEATNQKDRSEPLDRLLSDDDINSKNKKVNLQKKGLISFNELLAVENDQQSSPQNHMVEKTLYIDTIHKVEMETAKSDEGIFGISHIPKQDKETGFCEDPKVDRDLKVSQQSELELPAPPPLPKSPSDSWLWRTLPSMSSKNLSLRANPNPKYPTSNTRAKLENFQSRNPFQLIYLDKTELD
ncbi:unnamed protein product [Lactuca virosa]|uniref:Uncharacterized protein n=1 Tax=Lactuca virosa TaxID=75947 RepID=A0AAU9LUG8_9ASTR|nr:unnamed protein product [Lactuca virosa]